MWAELNLKLLVCLLMVLHVDNVWAEEAKSLEQSSDPLSNSIDNSLEEWKVPKRIRESFPMYIAGFDYEKRPITVVEYGRWNMRKLVEKGGEDLNIFDKYLDQVKNRFALGSSYPPLNQTFDSAEAPEGSVLIVDLEGFEISQVSSVPTVTYVYGLSRKLASLQEKLAYAYFINVNFVAETAINLSRPILGRSMERIEVYGTNSAIWKPKILKNIPADQIPPWLGGKGTGFKPVFIY